MEEAWRYRPMQNPNICPACSRAHFPFCAQPPLHCIPPRPPPPSFVHPHAEHYPMPVAGPGPYPRPIGNPASGDALVPPPDFSHLCNGNQMTARRGGFLLEEFDERTHKRMRIGDTASHSFPCIDFASAERERQLNLIREHGTQSLAHQDSNLGGYQGFEYDMYGQGQRFEEQRMAGGDLRIRNRFDPWLDSVTRVRPFLLPDQEAMNRQNNPANDQFLNFPRAENFHSQTQAENNFQSRKGSSQDSLQPHILHSQPDASMGAVNYGDPVWRNQDVVVDHRRDSQSMKWAEQVDQNQVDSSAHTCYENFQAQCHLLPTKEYSSGNSANHAQVATWQGTNAEHRGQGSHGRKERLPPNIISPQPSQMMQQPFGNMPQFHGQHSDVKSFEHRILPIADQSEHSGHPPMTASSKMNSGGTNLGGIYPPPPLPQRPFPKDPPQPHPSRYHSPSPPRTSSPLCPIPTSSAVRDVPGSPMIPHFPEFQPSAHSHLYSKQTAHSSNGFPAEGSQFVHQPLSNQYVGEGHTFQMKHSQPEKPKVINATLLFRQPHRAKRPDHIVIILRGLPGSGKSYLAKILRDHEVENGGNAPRIHSMDDYFMTEIEKVEEVDSTKSSSLGKGKKRITKKVMEYCYEPEMEEAYRSSMLKAFKKNLEEGNFTFLIVDDRNLRVADFAQFWATAKRCGYEVYLVEASYRDPMGCAARNVHGFTVEQIQKMAEQWEEAPPMYLKLDVQSLFHGDDLNDGSIQEVDMDMDDGFGDGGLSDVQDRKPIKAIESPSADNVPYDSLKPGEKWASEGELAENVKELRKSKWLEDLDDEADRHDEDRENLTALSGLVKAYGKGDKSVHWADEVGKSGFCIGSAKKSKAFSLLIGPGAGYNLDSNPLPEEDITDATGSSSSSSVGSNRRTTFLEQLRAERESFRVVFDRRRQRIGGLEVDDE